MKITVALTCVLVVAVVSAPAEIFTVTPDGTGDFPTIQEAIAAAVHGDVVEVSVCVFIGGV